LRMSLTFLHKHSHVLVLVSTCLLCVAATAAGSRGRPAAAETAGSDSELASNSQFMLGPVRVCKGSDSSLQR